MGEIIAFVLGAYGAGYYTYKFQQERVTDYKHFCEVRIEEGKQKFLEGFEIKHGYNPLEAEKSEPSIYEEPQGEQEDNHTRERWD